jgi:VWFA-related protein
MGRDASFSRRRLLCALSAWPALRALRGQNATFSTDVKVVSLFATVRDKQGKVVRDLTKDDFVLEEDRRPQAIKYFSQESDLPLTLGLLVDVSGSQMRLIPDERSASVTFFEQVLRDTDRAFVIHFQGQVELLQGLTSSRGKLEKALDLLEWPPDEPVSLRRRGRFPSRGGPSGPGRGRRWGGTALYDSVLLASDELMKKETGRKALVILTDGVDTASMVSLDEGVEAAQRADTLVYSVLFEDPDAYGGFRNGRGPLEQISSQTGGRLLAVSRKRTIHQVYESIEEELRSMYSIGYTPDRAEATDTYRKIRLTTKVKGLIVLTRDGYYA